jgi:hypothetical protein
MLLQSAEDTSLELKAVGYQFPHLPHEPYDADWLNINIRVKHLRGSWSSTDPCMLTWEMASLAKWLESIADGEPVDSEESFTEPNLRFELLEDSSKKLRVYFELECRPSWAPYRCAGMQDLWLDFDVNPEELRNAAASLRSDLQRFPIRLGF